MINLARIVVYMCKKSLITKNPMGTQLRVCKTTGQITGDMDCINHVRDGLLIKLPNRRYYDRWRNLID